MEWLLISCQLEFGNIVCIIKALDLAVSVAEKNCYKKVIKQCKLASFMLMPV